MELLFRQFMLLTKGFYAKLKGPVSRRHVPEIRQMDTTECGAACLAMILNYYGRTTTLTEIRTQCGVGRDGLSALTIVRVARSYGLRVRPVALQQADFRFIPLPAILHWGFQHFVVLESWSPQRIEIVDPGAGRRKIDAEELATHFTGVVLLMEPGHQFSRRGQAASLTLWSYFRQALLLPGFLLQLLVASLLLQLFGLGTPLLTKSLVDLVLPQGLSDILPLMGLGLLALLAMQSLTLLLRAYILIYLQARIDIGMMLHFFEHLLSLPYQFFQQRSNGDLVSRLNSNLSLRDMLTNQLISTFLDGGAVFIYFLLMLWESPWLALCTLLIGIIQICLLLASSTTIHHLTQNDLAAQGRAQGYITEALVNIGTIKASGLENRAMQHWTNLFLDHINISVRRDHLFAVIDTIINSLRMSAPLLLLWIGALLVINGSMSLGTMLALNTLAGSFLAPLSSLVSSGQKLQAIRAHFERISDVISASPEQNLEQVQQPPHLTGKIALKHIDFRYDKHAPLALQDINLTIEPGQKVALVGRTGSGKSTLGKLLLGLYTPTRGEIAYDDFPLHSLHYQAVRAQFGVVMQESALFGGSIRENISLSDPTISLERVIEAATLACIHEDILTMPMKYETAVAEGGSALSGGQRQRLSLARALVSRARVLFLDEATSHLDVVTEQQVEGNLNALNCTRIVIAHRLSTIQDADLILVLDQGRIVEQGNHMELLQFRGLYAQFAQNQLLLSSQNTIV